VPLLPGVVVAFNKELSGHVAVGAGPEHDSDRSARCGTRCAQGARFLGCTCIWAMTDSSPRCVMQLAHCAGSDPSFEFDPTRCDAVLRLDYQHRCRVATGSIVVCARC
jgi:hypothetical protein